MNLAYVSQHHVFAVLSVFLHTAAFCSFSLLCRFLLYGYITVYLCILMLTHTWALFSGQGLLCIICCTSLGRHEHSLTLGAYQEWTCWTIMYDSVLIISRCRPNFPKCLCYFLFPPTMYNNFSFFINSWYALFILAILMGMNDVSLF